MLLYALLSVLSSFAIIPLGKRGLVALHLWSSECHVLLSFFACHLSHGAVGWSVVCVVPGNTRYLISKDTHLVFSMTDHLHYYYIYEPRHMVSNNVAF